MIGCRPHQGMEAVLNLLEKNFLFVVVTTNLLVMFLLRGAVATEIEKTRVSSVQHHAYVLIVGSNQSGPNQQPLRCTHSDVQNVAAVPEQTPFSAGGYAAELVGRRVIIMRRLEHLEPVHDAPNDEFVHLSPYTTVALHDHRGKGGKPIKEQEC